MSGDSIRIELRPRAWSAEDDAELRQMRDQGCSAAVIAETLGRSVSAVRNRAYGLKITTDYSTPPEMLDDIRETYAQAGADGVVDLFGLSDRWGKSRANICRIAREMGLTNKHRRTVEVRKDLPKVGKLGSPELNAHMSAIAKERIAKNGHPRGMLGKKHREEVRALIGEKSAARWASMTSAERIAHTDKCVRSMLANGTLGAPQIKRGSWKAGWREIADRRHYFRSRWEANYALWLQWLKERGDIIEWEYEPHTFWFEKIKRGVRSYKPDFRVTDKTGEITWHEVKGWMDARSQTTLKRMAKYYPDEIIILVREPQIRTLGKWVPLVVEGWE